MPTGPGRRAALTLTLMLMALGSAVVAFTPSYAQIGIAAPIILVIARLIQGSHAAAKSVRPQHIYWNPPRPKSARA